MSQYNKTNPFQEMADDGLGDEAIQLACVISESYDQEDIWKGLQFLHKVDKYRGKTSSLPKTLITSDYLQSFVDFDGFMSGQAVRAMRELANQYLEQLDK